MNHRLPHSNVFNGPDGHLSATRQVSVMQVMQQSNIASSSATTSYNYGPPPPQQFSRAVQQQASVSRSLASNQNMGISSSQQMSPPPVTRQYFSQVEVCTTLLSCLLAASGVALCYACYSILMLCLCQRQHTMMS